MYGINFHGTYFNTNGRYLALICNYIVWGKFCVFHIMIFTFIEMIFFVTFSSTFGGPRVAPLLKTPWSYIKVNCIIFYSLRARASTAFFNCCLRLKVRRIFSGLRCFFALRWQKHRNIYPKLRNICSELRKKHENHFKLYNIAVNLRKNIKKWK